MKKLIATAAAALLLAGCSSSGNGDGGNGGSTPPGNTGSNGSTTAAAGLSGSITVYAAASLTETFNKLAGQFKSAHPGTEITFQYGSSGDLSTQITQGAPADVFASAATKNMDDVVKAGDASDPVNFASNTAQIAVPKGNPAKIDSIDDLAKAKVALCVVTAPCGKLAQTILSNAHLTITPTTQGPDVKATLAVVESGEVDAGIVYVTDIKADGGKVDSVDIPAGVNSTTEYPIATLKDSKNAGLAKAWVDYVTGPDGQQVLSAAGFAAP